MIIDRYVFRALAAPSVLGLLAWTSIFLVNYFFRLAEQWSTGTLSGREVVQALLYLLPSILAQTIPMSVLLGVLAGFSRLSADGEVTALRAAGVSYFRVLVPTGALACLGVLAAAAVYMEAVPWANTQYVELSQTALRRADVNREIEPGAWMDIDGAAIHARGVDQSDPEVPWLLDVDIVMRDRNKGEREHVHAERARINRLSLERETARLQLELENVRGVLWQLVGTEEARPRVWEATKTKRWGPERAQTGLRHAVNQRRLQKGARQKSLAELRETLTQLDEMDRIDAEHGNDPPAHAKARAGFEEWIGPKQRGNVRLITGMEIHKKYAIPLACLVFGLAGMPLGIATRRGGRPASFVVSIGVVLLWWVVYSVGEAWVLAGKLGPAAGAWLPDVVVAVVGLYLLIRLRRQQSMGLYRWLRDGQLLAGSILLGLSALLVAEHVSAPEGTAVPVAPWPPALGGALIVGYFAFVIFRDRIARTLDVIVQAFRRPRARWTSAERTAARQARERVPMAVGPADGRAARAASGPPPALTGGVRAGLERLRFVIILAPLVLAYFSAVEGLENGLGLREVLLRALTSWHGVAMGVIVVAGVVLQLLGVRIVKTLDFWILRGYMKTLGAVMLSVFMIYVVLQYLDIASSVLQHEIPLEVVLRFYANLTPRIVFETLPLTAMVSALVQFGVATKFNETTALRCGGVSIFRAVAPVLTVALILSAGAFLLHDHVLPEANQRASDLHDQIRGRAAVVRGSNRQLMFGSDGHTLYHYDRMLGPTGRKDGQPHFLGLTVLKYDSSGAVREVRAARDAAWDGERWVLRAGWRARLGQVETEEFETFQVLPDPSIEEPDYFVAGASDPEAMTFAEYRRYIDAQAAAGYPTDAQQVRLQERLAFPSATMVLVLVGLPFAFTTGRRGALYGLGISVILAVAYYVVLAGFSRLGEAEVLPPVVAAWSPNILFGLAGVFGLLNVRT